MRTFLAILIFFLCPTAVFAADFTVSVDQDVYAPNEVILVDWTLADDSPTQQNWVGIFTANASNQQYRDWKYVDSNTTGRIALSERTPGTYEARLFVGNGYTAVAESEPFTISTGASEDPDTPPNPTYNLTVSTQEIETGELVTLSWEAGSNQSNNDWVGLYRVGTSDQAYIDWFYIQQVSGSRDFSIDTSGEYEFRYYKNNGYTRSAISPVVRVVDGTEEPTDPDPQPSEYNLSLNSSTVGLNETITVSYQAPTDADSRNDWIGLYRVGTSDQNYIDWQYTSGSNGDLSFQMRTAGTYEIRYFINNGYTRVAVSNTFDVVRDEDDQTDDPAPPPTTNYEVRADQNSYRVGDTANAIWQSPDGANIIFDWIGLYRVGSADNRYIEYEYVDIFSNREQFTLTSIGTFEFRYFKNNGYERVATSDPFTVSDNGGTNLCNGYNLDTVTNYPTENGPIIALGDSITFGVGASPGEDYVEELEQRLNVNIINAGVPTDTTQDVLERLEADVLTRNPSTVIIFIGGNDELRRIYASLSDSAADRQLADELDEYVRERLGYEWDQVPLLTREETFENLRTIVTRTQATGANTIVVGFDNTLYNDTIATNYARIANQTGSLYVPDIYDNIFGRPSRMSDLVHPNDVGYDIIADRIEQALECLVN